MDTIKAKPGDQVTCPHCKETYPKSEGLIEDFVVPNKLGAASRTREQCISCDEWFTVTRTTDAEFEIKPV